MQREDNSSTFARISTATTTTLKVGQGVLRSVILNKPVASSTITIYDSLSASGTIIGVITNTTDVKPYSLPYFAKFTTGLTIVSSSTDDVTVTYD